MTWVRWPAATIVAYALAAVTSVALLNLARPLGGVLSGVIFIALFGAEFGAVVAIVQYLGLARRANATRWVVFSALGGAAGYVLAALVGEALAAVISPTGSIVVGGGAIQDLSGAALGVCIGLAQSRALGLGRWWVVATAVGLFLGQGTAAAVLELLEVAFLKGNLIPSFGAILGLFTGIAQAVVWWRVSAASRSASAAAGPSRR